MKPARKATFLARLAQDTAGNTLAIMAAAFFPLAALIGGGVDMSRIYITKTRLQQACDAGALSGRKAMASGAWTTTAGGSRDQADAMFAANFQDGDFGASELDSEFNESDGTVTGTASADVPMTLMRIFSEETRTVSVTCTAKMEIPNTDVMFVLDTTLSMECAPADAALACNTNVAAASKRITGLRKAVKCFYEALLKVNTSETCGNDPTATSYSGTAQVRLGFVPYATNVNVGKLLDHSFMADNWTYPSRQANHTTVYAWTAGSESGNWGNWSNAPTLNLANGYSGWADVPNTGSGNTSPTLSINGTNRTKRPKGSNNSELSQTACENLNTLTGSGKTMLDYTDSGNVQSASPSGPAAPTHPTTTQSTNYTQADNHTVKGYRYRYNNVTTDDCRLQVASDRTYTLNRSRTTNRTITWTPYERFDSWTYFARSIQVSGLKGAQGAWNTAVSVPYLSRSTVSGIKLSGSNTVLNNYGIAVAADSVAWGGCILERQTVQNHDGVPAGEWAPIPDEALDLDIDLVPNDDQGSKWGPLLQNAYYGRQSGSNRTTTDITTTSTDPGWERGDYYCPFESRKLKEYTSSTDTTDFVDYIDDLTTVSRGTYHDIGMLWGARLLSPTGIFADENDYTDEGGAIERHLIFMTDGSTQTAVDNLYAYGLPWWDRRQTSYAPGTDGASQQHLDLIVNARLEAMCTRIKGMNIQLWVISYGAGVNETNKTRLTNCASPGRFYDAADSATLLSRFQQIASEIADLRLTQ